MDMLIAFLTSPFLGKAIWLWLLFLGLVIGLMAFDLGILNKDGHELTIRESLKLSVFYIGIALAYGAYLWWLLGSTKALEYYTGYAVEKALSIDNVFVISLIFAYFKIPTRLQYRALVWGILAVILLRFIMIAAGAALVSKYHWVLYLFAMFLIATGFRMLFAEKKDLEIEHNPVLVFMRKYMRVTDTLHEGKFFVRMTDKNTGRLATFATPLFMALAVINVADIIFAVDSVPAIFAITTDTFIVFTSNIMAILGLRALYFALQAMVDRFKYVEPALALVLVTIGFKIFWNDLVSPVHPAISLAVTLGLIIGGVVYSLMKTPKH